MKKFSVLSIFVFVFITLACISLAQLLSTTIVAFSTDVLIKEVCIDEQTLYAISTNKSQIEKEISTFAEELREKDGAGFIYFTNDYYYNLASLYENKNDAEHVKTKLSEENVESEILKITLPKQVVKGTFNANEKEILSDCLEANYQIFRKLYDVAISLDTKICDKNKVKLDCNSIYSQLISIKTNFQTFFKDKKEFKNIQENLDKNEKILTNLISENFESTNQTLSSLIKMSYCKIVLETK